MARWGSTGGGGAPGDVMRPLTDSDTSAVALLGDNAGLTLLVQMDGSGQWRGQIGGIVDPDIIGPFPDRATAMRETEAHGRDFFSEVILALDERW